MRFATWEHEGTTTAGVVSDAGLHALPAGTTVLDVVRAGLPAALEAGAAALDGPAVPLASVRLLPPLDPPTVRDFVAFEEHVEGVVAGIGDGGGVVPEWYEAPTFYFTNPHALVGAHDDVPVPPGSALFDFELEVAAVVGRDGASLTPEQAREHVFGYTIFNDWSARDLQRREMRVSLGPAKGKDSATTLGPWLVTADELEPHRDGDGFLALDLRVAVNGTEVGQDLLSNMGWPFEELLSYASRGTWVRAGDVLGSGTCGNGGCLAELWGRNGAQTPPPLRPGDVVEMTVEGIGTIRNRVVAGAELPPVRPARHRPRSPRATVLRGHPVFEYFPGNYVWNLAVVATLNSGGLIDEVDRACRPIKEAAARGEDAGTADFLRAWTALTDQLVAQAEDAEKAGRTRTAGQLYARATNYLCQAERMLSNSDPNRIPTYRRVLRLQQKAFDLKDPRITRVEVPYEGTTLPAYFSAAPATDDGPAPVIVLWNGLDSTKEHMYSSGHWAELAARGVSCLMVDCPGSGEALRLQGLTARVDTEAWAAACVDHLLTRDDVDPARIGLTGWSLGGYYAPRAAAFEDRLALVVAWGANHDWGAVQRRRLEREGERPVPHYWEHVLWVWGHTDLDAFIDFADAVNLDGVVERIGVPFLIAHGENDRQIPLAYAHRSYDQATASPHRELRVFTPAEGATEHIGLDHLPHVSTFIADWVADAFAGRSS